MNKTNKFLFILGVATALFTSCSSDDTLETSKGPELTEDEKWVLEANSDERIELGSGDNSFTRAFVGEGAGETDTLFTTNEGIGVFCLASAKINPKDSKVPEIKWDQYTNSDLTKRNEGRYMNWMGMNTNATLAKPTADKSTNFVTWGGNVYANAYQPHRDEVSGEYVTRISWGDEFTRFYPMGNWYTYTFYGYHPYQWNAANVKTTDKKVDVTIPIDGFTDVLWGRSFRPSDGTVETADSCAYSGKYFRQYRKAHSTEAPTPTMVFKHALSRINFMVGRGDSTANSGSIYIQELKLLGDVPNSVDLNVATLDAAANVKPKPTETGYFNGDPVNKAEGKVTTSSTATYLTTKVPDGFNDDGDIIYLDKQNGVDLPYKVTYNTANVITELSKAPEEERKVTMKEVEGKLIPDYKQLGTGIIVPPTATPDYKVQLTIQLVREEKGGPKTYTFIPQFPYPISFPAGGLEQGKQYNVRITVYTPQDIRINAELVEWEKVEVGGGSDPGIEI